MNGNDWNESSCSKESVKKETLEDSSDLSFADPERVIEQESSSISMKGSSVVDSVTSLCPANHKVSSTSHVDNGCKEQKVYAKLIDHLLGLYKELGRQPPPELINSDAHLKNGKR